MAKLNIKGRCGRCTGTGIDDNQKDAEGSPITESCTSCDGTGLVNNGEIDTTELQADVDKILRRTKKIMDKLEITE
jgi:excinuclease UvrABC ATPase subunit